MLLGLYTRLMGVWSGLQARMRNEDGVLATEYVILLVLIEFGITLYGEEQWVSSARDGARYAAVKCAPDARSGGCTSALISQRIANEQCSGDTGCLTNTPTLYFGASAVTANYCTDPNN